MDKTGPNKRTTTPSAPARLDEESVSTAMRLLEQEGAVRWANGTWVHEANVEAQRRAENILRQRYGREYAHKLIKSAIESTSVETPPNPK